MCALEAAYASYNGESAGNSLKQFLPVLGVLYVGWRSRKINLINNQNNKLEKKEKEETFLLHKIVFINLTFFLV